MPAIPPLEEVLGYCQGAGRAVDAIVVCGTYTDALATETALRAKEPAAAGLRGLLVFPNGSRLRIVRGSAGRMALVGLRADRVWMDSACGGDLAEEARYRLARSGGELRWFWSGSGS